MIFKIDNIDITPYIARGGVRWTRADVDGPLRRAVTGRFTVTAARRSWSANASENEYAATGVSGNGLGAIKARNIKALQTRFRGGAIVYS
jgi:hypothetical protein